MNIIHISPLTIFHTLFSSVCIILIITIDTTVATPIQTQSILESGKKNLPKKKLIFDLGFELPKHFFPNTDTTGIIF